jgi:HAMP domain-containing protein
VVWWIVSAIVLFALFVLVVAMVTVARRLGPLRDVQRLMRIHAETAVRLREPALALQGRAKEMENQLLEIQRQVEARQARQQSG